MPIHTVPAIILQGYETGETSEVLRTFSGQFGRLSIMAKGLRGNRGRFAGLLQPLVEAELTISLREAAPIGTLRDVSMIDSHDPLRLDLDRLALAAVIADIAVSCCEEGQPAPEMFNETRAALHQLEDPATPQSETAAAHRLIRLLSLAGYEPAFGDDITQPWPASKPRPRLFSLDIHNGTIHIPRDQPRNQPTWPMRMGPATTHVPLPPSAVRALHINRNTTAEQIPTLPPIDRGEAIQLIEALVRLAQYHLGHELRSARFWRGINRKNQQ